MVAVNPKFKTILLVTGIVISIAVAVAVGYLFESRLFVWIIGVLAAGILGICLYLLIRHGYNYEWTGFGRPEKKTVWDWMDLLIVPAVLALATLAFTLYQENRQTRIENLRAEAERKVADQRADDAALQGYLDQTSTLLLNENVPLRESKEGDEVRTLTRARTLAVLGSLESPHNKRTVIEFLHEAKLITGTDPIISLKDADLQDANLAYLDLYDANLALTDLRDANLSHACLKDADLGGANLSEADLSEADLSEQSNLHAAILIGTDVSDPLGMTPEELKREVGSLGSLEGATMPKKEQGSGGGGGQQALVTTCPLQ
jgi:Pentapeptide repeats (8 copies)